MRRARWSGSVLLLFMLSPIVPAALAKSIGPVNPEELLPPSLLNDQQYAQANGTYNHTMDDLRSQGISAQLVNNRTFYDNYQAANGQYEQAKRTAHYQSENYCIPAGLPWALQSWQCDSPEAFGPQRPTVDVA